MGRRQVVCATGLGKYMQRQCQGCCRSTRPLLDFRLDPPNLNQVEITHCSCFTKTQGILGARFMWGVPCLERLAWHPHQGCRTHVGVAPGLRLAGDRKPIDESLRIGVRIVAIRSDPKCRVHRSRPDAAVP